MIAQRFRPLGWVAGIALAATALYLVSLQVATERGRLETIDKKIAATKREIRQLQTEMGTRASLRQLERWNGEVLSLSAPQAGQYLSGEAALASLNQDKIGRSPAAPPPAMVAVADIKAAQPATIYAKLTSAQPLPKLTVQDRKIVQTVPLRPARADIALLDRSAISSLAKVETGAAKIRDKAKQ